MVRSGVEVLTTVVTGMVKAFPVAGVITIEPWQVPAGRPPALTLTVRVAGVVEPDELTSSQFAPQLAVDDASWNEVCCPVVWIKTNCAPGCVRY